jgi:RNA polymerase sigma-70 factor (ECF subfamily)
MNAPETDELDVQDMRRLSEGHPSALNELMARHAEKLFHYLVRSLQDEDDAADLAQETFVRVFQNRARFDVGQKFTTWLYTIASNLVKDRYRWRRRHPQVSLDAEIDASGASYREALPEHRPTPADQVTARERAEAVRRAIAELPAELRQPLILAEYEERSHAEISVILGCTPKAVETRVYRARRQLRTALKGVMSSA